MPFQPLRHSLLSDPLFSVRRPGGAVERMTLGEVLAALFGNGVESFAALAAHQRQGWHCFLVQLAALALHRAGREEPPADAASWTGLLRALTPDHADDAPWCLVVADPARPAFLQSPVGAGGLERFKNRIATPDGIDLLITAKNHDVKLARLAAATAEHWVYALVNLQTMQGFLGRGNYGIVRMNGGFASRPRVARAPAPDWGPRVRRDLAVLRDGRADVLRTHEAFRADGGLALLWLVPWEREEELPLAALDPWCIEVCRRLRLGVEGGDGRLFARTRPSETPRVDAQGTNGNVGDPWIPLDARGAALTVGGAGFDYRLLARLVSVGAGGHAAAQRPRRDDPPGDILLAADVLVRGQGKTDGLHERQIPIPARARRFLDTGSQKVGEVAERQVAEAADLRLKVLKPALLVLLQGGPDRDGLDRSDRRADPWLARYDRAVDEWFFPALWESLDGDRSDHWPRRLGGIGWELLHLAEGALPIPSARRYRALARAEERFERAFFHRFAMPLHSP